MPVFYVPTQRINPQDPTAPKKFYARAKHIQTISLRQLAKELAARSTTASEGDVYAVLIGMFDLMREHLGRSNKIHIEGLGTFSISIASSGADTEDKLTVANIKGYRLTFQPESEMKHFTSGLTAQKYKTKK